MKTTHLPDMMYAVAAASNGIVWGQIYGPYNRIQDAEKALERAQKYSHDIEYLIIYTTTKWVTYIK